MAALKFRGEPLKSLNPSYWPCVESLPGSVGLSAPAKKVASRRGPATDNGHLIACFCLSPLSQGLLALMGFRAMSQIEGLLTVAVMGYSQQYEAVHHSTSRNPRRNTLFHLCRQSGQSAAHFLATRCDLQLIPSKSHKHPLVLTTSSLFLFVCLLRNSTWSLRSADILFYWTCASSLLDRPRARSSP